MKDHGLAVRSATAVPEVPPILPIWLAALRDCFSAPVCNRVLVLVAGAILTPGTRTVSTALRVMGLADAPGFARYHEVLSRARWNGRAVARRLLVLILDTFLPAGPVVIGIDDTIERRWGPRIAARGIYRDPVRSSRGHFVKASGLRWLALMVIVPIPWAGRRWALPFLTVLAPSKPWSDARGTRHKTLTDWARQAILQARRWLPHRRIIVVADGGFTALDLIAAIRRHVCLVSRLRLDASLFAPPPPRRSGQIGRPRVKGARLPKFAEVLISPDTLWVPVTLTEWYGGQKRTLEITSGTAVWYHSGLPPAPILWILARDPAGDLEPQAFLTTDLEADPAKTIACFVLRWRVETTFQELRTHLGVETQRQWSEAAIARTTPALLGLFSLVTIWAHQLAASTGHNILPCAAAWYPKPKPSFSDAIAAVRLALWAPPPDLSMSRPSPDGIIIPIALFRRMTNTLCHPT
jgi:hypothetical protein